MKKLLALALCLGLLLSLLPAFAAGVTPIMQVVKCNEYVSLREKPDTKSTRIYKVHLGELVTNCSAAENEFIRCEWNGRTGYILAKYLQMTDYKYSDGILVNQMVTGVNEWASLRKTPSTSAERLAKVPLYAIVTSCTGPVDGFIRCTYKGKTGYILAKYLKKADYSYKPTPTPTVKPTATPTPTPVPYYPPLPDQMMVVNVNEWASLRAKPNANSAQLQKIPLGGVVYGCVQVNDKYVECVYNGQTGYVAKQYLQEYVPSYNYNGFDALGLDMPTLEAFESLGTEVLKYSFNGYTVVARRLYYGEKEELKVVCYDASWTPRWSTGVESDHATELYSTEAFIMGSADRPLIVLFLTGYGFTAYPVGYWQDVEWENTSEDAQHVGGSLSTAVGKDGTAYLIGYYESAPLALSKEGVILWRAKNDSDFIYWPYEIRLGENSMEVLYDSFASNQAYCYSISYDYDGKNLGSALKLRPEAQ